MRNTGSQWLRYLTALSLSLASSAYALPARASVSGDTAVSQRATSALNDMAQTQAAAVEPVAETWPQIVWAQWTRIIIIYTGAVDAQTAPSEDFGSYAGLLDRVKSEA